MNKSFWYSAGLIIFLCCTGCVNNLRHIDVVKYPIPICNSFEDAVRQATRYNQWRIIDAQPGKIACLLMIRKHSLVVNVFYDDRFFYIDYERSTNLNYHSSEDLIDKHYAIWTRKLAKDIQVFASKQNSKPLNENSLKTQTENQK